jgi:NitT/TauT family transport system substrate-binding protein
MVYSHFSNAVYYAGSMPDDKHGSLVLALLTMTSQVGCKHHSQSERNSNMYIGQGINIGHRLALLGLVLVLLGASFSGCARQPATLEAINLPMGYVANVQFSPFYVTHQRGYFSDAGFDVSFDYRWETDGIQLVAAGELPFTIASGDQVIQARSMGLPVVAIAAWWQSFPVSIIALEATPLDSPSDLRGLRIGLPETFGASYIGLRALLEAGGLTERDVDLQAIGYAQLAALTAGTVDAVVVYTNNEPVVLGLQGIAFHQLRVMDYANLVSNVLVSSDTYLAENPEKATRFVEAFLKGLEETLGDPDAAFEVSESYVEGLADNRTSQWAVLQTSLQLWTAPTLGVMNAGAWEQAQHVMQEAGLIQQPVPVDTLFTNDFLPAAD